jgi:hypothetical protein
MIAMMLDWNDISPGKLRKLCERLSDGQIAEMYDIPVGKVRYKRKKFGLMRTAARARPGSGESNSKIMRGFNDSARRLLTENPDIDMLAKATAQYVFRSGVVEDIHAEGKLSDADMKALNIFFSNRLAGILTKVFAGEWLQILLLFEFYKALAAGWDKVEPDVREFEMLFEQYTMK